MQDEESGEDRGDEDERGRPGRQRQRRRGRTHRALKPPGRALAERSVVAAAASSRSSSSRASSGGGSSKSLAARQPCLERAATRARASPQVARARPGARAVSGKSSGSSGSSSRRKTAAAAADRADVGSAQECGRQTSTRRQALRVPSDARRSRGGRRGRGRDLPAGTELRRREEAGMRLSTKRKTTADDVKKVALAALRRRSRIVRRRPRASPGSRACARLRPVP